MNDDSTKALASLALLADYLDEDEELTKYGTTFANEQKRKEIIEIRSALKLVGEYADGLKDRPAIV